MRIVRTTYLIATAGALAVAVGATTGHAAFPNKCASGKEQCVSKKAAALLKCHTTAELKGTLDPVCLQKAMDKFDGGLVPTKGCFARLEVKLPCYTTGDTAAMETAADGFVAAIVRRSIRRHRRRP